MKKIIIIQVVGDLARAVEKATGEYARFARVVTGAEAAREALSEPGMKLIVAVMKSGQGPGLDGMAASRGWLVERKSVA